MNQARTDPKSYVPIIEEELKYMKNGVIRKPGQSVGLQTHEGDKAYKEAISYLNSAKAVHALKWNDSLALAA